MCGMENNNSGSKTPPSSILLRGAEIVVRDQSLTGGSILIENERISSVWRDEQLKVNADETLDLDRLRVFPGFIDVHIHGAVGVDTMVAGKDDLERVSRFLLTNGVTGWLPTLVPAAATDYENAVRAIDAVMDEQQLETRGGKAARGARVLGVHYEGPFVNTSQCGALHPTHFKSFSTSADLDALPTPESPHAVRMMTLAPEVEGGVELIRELVRRGWIVSLGHTRAGIEVLDQALAAGARHMTHFMNAMPPMHHRAPGPVGWGLAHDDVTVDLIADGVHLDPFVLRVLLRLKNANRLALISDAIAAAGQGDGDYQIWGETIAVRNGRTSNIHGSIAGSVITMLDAARTMRSLGASEIEVARMTSTNPARLLGIEHECGSIETGKRADLVAINQDGAVQLTIIAGEVVFQA
jgi:N-acetylglucosamine-6-phosphate deacetylase